MRAYVTSIGEPTTDLCIWSLERLGFEVKLLSTKISLAKKLEIIYNHATEDFIRVDADVIVNKNLLLLPEFTDLKWFQFLTFDWYKQDTTTGGVQYISKDILPELRANIKKFYQSERPESQMYRIDELHNPRRCRTVPVIAGIHGYGQNNIDYVKEVKTRRGQLDSYDFELAEVLSQI